MTPVDVSSPEYPPLTTVAHRRRFRWRGAAGIAILTPAAIVAALGTPVVTPSSWVDFLLALLARGAFLTGAGFRSWATHYSGGRKADVVVSEGPYPMCRHPLYFCTILLIVSGALFLKSVVFAAAVALLATTYYMFTIPAEE